MTEPIMVSVRLRGPLFTKRITPLVEAAILSEALEKIGERMERGGKGLGAKRNVVTLRRNALTLEAASTLRRPRTKGTAWTRKNVGIVRAMAPRVLNAVARRVVAELTD